ncbi:hypothetical protein TIFTF001_030445 [Ficus carica]|uniref:Uncharacterized protein n=1 Tax=Ficus carica TaxID=3494 RepID=A0AA88DTB4_FICCA|nr:hypothetical protein TIFTF001_030382 [Ficus carica]GMN61353.1 hypothetical protein TIFTF001_030445 [Ficus carica]
MTPIIFRTGGGEGVLSICCTTFRSFGSLSNPYVSFPFSVRNSLRCPFFSSSTTSARRLLVEFTVLRHVSRWIIWTFVFTPRRLFFSRLGAPGYACTDLCLRPFFSAYLAVPSSCPENLRDCFAKALDLFINSSESSANESMDSGGRLQNHLRAAPFKLCAKNLHIMSLSISVGMFIDYEKRYSICASNVLISSDIMLRIMASTFIVPGGTRPSGDGGNSGVTRRVRVVFLLELGPGTGCVCARPLVAIGAFPDVERGCIGATGLCAVVRIP